MRRDLGDGLVLRWSTAADADDIVELVGRVFREKEDAEPNVGLSHTVRRYVRGDYPFMGPDDFLVVEDTRKDGNRIVACTCYLLEDWEFDGIPIPAARPEIVATDPAYRNRGLIRSIFDTVHERAERDGRVIQGITGIPYFYRQFGYEFAIDLGGRLSVPVALLPEPPDGKDASHLLRQASLDDVPSVAACYRSQQAGSLVSCHLPDSFWRYHIEAEQSPDGLSGHSRVRVIETAQGEFCGFVLTPYRRYGEHFPVSLLGFRPGLNLHELAPALMRGLRRMADQLPVGDTGVPPKEPTKPLQKIQLNLGRDHPFYRAVRSGWSPQLDPPYAWYIRVPDLPGFLRLVAPVLDRRLADSSMAGYTGEIKLDFYRGGLRMALENGKLATVEDHRFAAYDSSAKGGFPPLTFLRLVFGHDSLAELRAMYPDVWAEGEAEAVLETLFPKRRSHLIGL